MELMLLEGLFEIPRVGPEGQWVFVKEAGVGFVCRKLMVAFALAGPVVLCVGRN